MKVVITAGGIGTRLLPVTKEYPKEMLPLFSKDPEGNIFIKPLLQINFEYLYEAGFRDFCFVVGKGKSSVANHFIPDKELLNHLKQKNKYKIFNNLSKFYSMIEDSKTKINWIYQLGPKGFGDAVLRASSFVGSDPFFVYAGDTVIISRKNSYLKKLRKVFNNNKYDVDAALLVTEVEDPTQYGIIEGEKISDREYRVTKIIEKPKKPPTNLAASGIYVFDPIIIKALKKTKKDPTGEIQLTDAIQKLIEWGDKKNVYAYKLGKGEHLLDIGKPETYKVALDKSYNLNKCL